LVGWRVRVFWKAENAWFYGTVKAFDAASGKHAVSYDDGDEQTLALKGGGATLGFLRAPRKANGARKSAAAEFAAKKPRAAPERKSSRVPKRRAESPPPPREGCVGRTAYARPRRRDGSARRSRTRPSARARRGD
jgi:hypothetical protein